VLTAAVSHEDDPVGRYNSRHAELLRRDDIRAMPFGHDVVAEPQHFAHQALILIAVDDDNGVDASVDALDDEPKVRNSLQCLSPVLAQRWLSAHDACCLWHNPGGYRRSEHHILVKMLEDSLHIVGIPRLHPPVAKRDRINFHDGTVVTRRVAVQHILRGGIRIAIQGGPSDRNAGIGSIKSSLADDRR
jgi:hypothetical protein